MSFKHPIFYYSLLAFFGTTQILWAQNNTPQFKLDVAQNVYKINAQLTHGNLLQIRFAKAADWRNQLVEMTNIAASQYRFLSDSFKNPVSQKNLFLKIPKDTGLVTIQWAETKYSATHRMIYKNGRHIALKTTKDTLIILKDGDAYKNPIYLSNDSNQTIRQVQYTFVLRNIKDIETIAADTQLLQTISRQVDSVLENGPLKKNSDKRLTMNIRNHNGYREITTKKDNFWNHIFVPIRFGAELLNGNFGMSSDVGYAYADYPDSKNSFFAMLNITAFYFPGSNIAVHNAYGCIAFELGTANTTSGSLLDRYSMGLGYFIGTPKLKGNETNLPNMFRWYFNFPVNSKLNIGFDILTDFRFKAAENNPKETHSMLGVYLKYSIY